MTTPYSLSIQWRTAGRHCGLLLSSRRAAASAAAAGYARRAACTLPPSQAPFRRRCSPAAAATVCVTVGVAGTFPTCQDVALLLFASWSHRRASARIRPSGWWFMLLRLIAAGAFAVAELAVVWLSSHVIGHGLVLVSVTTLLFVAAPLSAWVSSPERMATRRRGSRDCRCRGRCLPVRSRPAVQCTPRAECTGRLDDM